MFSGNGSSVPWYTISMLTRFLHMIAGAGHDQRPELIDVIIALSPYDDSTRPVVHLFVVDRYFSNGIVPIHFIYPRVTLCTHPGYGRFNTFVVRVNHECRPAAIRASATEVKHPGQVPGVRIIFSMYRLSTEWTMLCHFFLLFNCHQRGIQQRYSPWRPA